MTSLDFVHLHRFALSEAVLHSMALHCVEGQVTVWECACLGSYASSPWQRMYGPHSPQHKGERIVRTQQGSSQCMWHVSSLASPQSHHTYTRGPCPSEGVSSQTLAREPRLCDTSQPAPSLLVHVAGCDVSSCHRLSETRHSCKFWNYRRPVPSAFHRGPRTLSQHSSHMYPIWSLRTYNRHVLVWHPLTH